eukprot:m.483167 g.483167  ORF g.483167 m.483167 type:complete len:91 (+) comp22802_c0_seq1:822-1094(+)
MAGSSTSPRCPGAAVAQPLHQQVVLAPAPAPVEVALAVAPWWWLHSCTGVLVVVSGANSDNVTNHPRRLGVAVKSTFDVNYVLFAEVLLW